MNEHIIILHMSHKCICVGGFMHVLF